MFRYGLVGNTIVFGGVIGVVSYAVYEILNIGNESFKMDEGLANELFRDSFSPIKKDKINPNALKKAPRAPLQLIPENINNTNNKINDDTLTKLSEKSKQQRQYI